MKVIGVWAFLFFARLMLASKYYLPIEIQTIGIVCLLEAFGKQILIITLGNFLKSLKYNRKEENNIEVGLMAYLYSILYDIHIDLHL